MPTTTEAAPVLHEGATSINGVSLYTRKGEPKRRYSESERRQCLGCSEEQLRAYFDLFAPRRMDFAVTRAGSGDPRDWTGGRGMLTLDRVARHLVGARLPGVYPQWVAPRGWDWTLFAAIDVDCRGDPQEFLGRCLRLEAALALLDVPPEARLVVPTPSGGRHYYFFTTQRIRTAEIAPTLAKVGIIARKGRFEIFPSTTQGLRLPFGHVPGGPHRPDEWLQFIYAYQRGAFPTVNWEFCKHLARQHAGTRGGQRLLFPNDPDEPPEPADELEPPGPARPQVVGRGRPLIMGLPRERRPDGRQYEGLAAGAIQNSGDIRELWKLGIQEEGTRHEAVKQLAWHFVFARGYAEEEATSVISDWAYRTGERTSKDVRADIARGTRKVEEDVGDLVRYFVRLREEGEHAPGSAFAAAELDAIRKATESLPSGQRLARARFLLEFLRFGKSHGEPTPDGWQCRPAVRGILRQWPGCSGMRYKRHLDWAKDAGLIVLVREKRQSSDGTGRARTYLLRLPPVERVLWTLSREEAVEYLSGTKSRQPEGEAAAGRPSESDTYRVGLPTQEEDREGEATASDPARETVAEDNGTAEPISPCEPAPLPTSHRVVSDPERRNPHDESDPVDPADARDLTQQHTPGDRPGDAGSEHPGRAAGRLAEGTPERPGVQPPLQGVRHPPLGGEPALSALPPAHPGGTDTGRGGQLTRDRVTFLTRPTLQRCRRHARSRFDAPPDPAADLVALPPPTDRAAIAAAIQTVKQALAAAYPGQNNTIHLHPCWLLIEAMALDSTYSVRQRSVLLANPLYLSPSDLAFRKELIRGCRDRPPPTSSPAGGSSLPIHCYAHGPPPISTAFQVLSG